MPDPTARYFLDTRLIRRANDQWEEFSKTGQWVPAGPIDESKLVSEDVSGEIEKNRQLVIDRVGPEAKL